MPATIRVVCVGSALQLDRQCEETVPQMPESDFFQIASERLKYECLGSRFEWMLSLGQHAVTAYKSSRRPELRDLLLEHRDIRAVLSMLLTKESRCIDVGAHIGSVLNELLRLAPRGRHVAFEPLPRKARWLQAKYPEVRVLQAAVGNTIGSAWLFLSPRSSALNGLFPLRESVCDARRIEVAQTTLDASVGFDDPVHFLKVDVEGGELQVLEGARQLLLRQRPYVLFESTVGGLERSRVSTGALFKLLTSMAYDVYVPSSLLRNKPPLTEADFAECHVYPFKAFNFFALPRQPSRASLSMKGPPSTQNPCFAHGEPLSMEVVPAKVASRAANLRVIG